MKIFLHKKCTEWKKYPQLQNKKIKKKNNQNKNGW